jgi:hypothetical protein
MARDRSYDRGRAWRAGDEEEGGYGQRGLEGTQYGLERPRYGRYPGGESNGGVDYPAWPGRDRPTGRGSQNPIDRGAGAYAGVGPRGYRRSDERIAEDVNEGLTRNSRLDPSDVEVRVENGEVTLEGEVESRAAKRLAEDIAEAASGVFDVHNRLRIRNAGRAEPDPIDPPTM